MKINDEYLKNLALMASNNGWRLLVVGGAVRDDYLGVESKDIDLEVYGPSHSELDAWLRNFGEVQAVGASFGVYKLYPDFADDVLPLDVSLPRSESKTGKGHKGFDVEVETDPRRAARRRDFTINSTAYDPLTDAYVDYFRGRDDLRRGALHPTSEAFMEDELRPLRGMQFAARFNLKATARCKVYCRRMQRKGDYDHIVPERVWEEWWKWATKGDFPSAGLRFLTQTNWIENYPELYAMVGEPQDPIHHPEGDVWTHTMLTCDAMVNLARDLEPEDRAVLMFAALLHDVGKPHVRGTHPETHRITTYGHDTAGVWYADLFLALIMCPLKLRLRIIPLVREHMCHVHVRGGISRRTVRRLAVRLGEATIDEWLKVVEADNAARPPIPSTMPIEAFKISMIAQEELVRFQAPKEILMGRHLIKVGWTPGPHFGRVIADAFQAQLDGLIDSEETALGWLHLNFPTEKEAM